MDQELDSSQSASDFNSTLCQPQPSPAASEESLVPNQETAQSERNHEHARSPPLSRAPLIQVDARRELLWWDVSALIINKMIGTGIFTGPPTVLMYTGRKDSALLIWAGGFAYTLINMTLYLEFSRKLPYTGGELVYLDELIPRPTLLSYTCYALYFCCLYSTATNGMQFARQTILAATGEDVRDQRIMRFIAVVITTVTCLLLYFSTASGRRLNRWLAYLKVLLMFVIFVAGADMARKSATRDNTVPVPSPNSATAILQVLFAFQGWENGTLVAGEIQNHETLRKGFIRAVWIVGMFYMLINIVYCYAIPWNEDGGLELEYVPLVSVWFFGNSDAAKQAWAILTAFSAVGSMISVTYSCVRVKQTIAWTNILPWSPFWRKSAPIAKEEPKTIIELIRLRGHGLENQHTLQTGEPQGGLVLHWVVCVIHICATAAISVVTEAISFPGQLITYAHAMFGVVLGFYFAKFRDITNKVPASRRWEPPEFESWWLKPKFAPIVFGWIYALGSIALLILAVLGPYKNTDKRERVVKGWLYPAISGGLLGLSLLYYLLFIANEKRSLVRAAGVQLRKSRHGEGDGESIMRKCDACNDRPGAHRHARDGYENYYEVAYPDMSGQGSVLYWIFGGTEELHHPRAFQRFENMRDAIRGFQRRLKEKLSNLPGLSKG